MGIKSFVRSLSGRSAVVVLNGIGRVPTRVTMAFGSALLPLYIPFRRQTRARLHGLTPHVPTLAYYRMRLRLALLSLRHILGRPDGSRIIVEGGDLFADALSSGNPVALLGWHQGPVELLHRLPAAQMSREGGRDTELAKRFFLFTASAFSPALSEWMKSGRRARGTTVIRPDDTAALRAWAREKGVLAVMIDQVPGTPEDWLTLRGGTVRLPWPRRLVDWITARHPVCLAVSVGWEPGDRLVFRYDRLQLGEPGALKDGVSRLMDQSIARAPEQYNWSYPKVRFD